MLTSCSWNLAMTQEGRGGEKSRDLCSTDEILTTRNELWVILSRNINSNLNDKKIRIHKEKQNESLKCLEITRTYLLLPLQCRPVSQLKGFFLSPNILLSCRLLSRHRTEMTFTWEGLSSTWTLYSD